MAAGSKYKASQFHIFHEQLSAGHSITSIARGLGIPRNTVQGWKSSYESGNLRFKGKSVFLGNEEIEADSPGSATAVANRRAVRELEKANKELQAQVDQLQKERDDALKPRTKYKPFQAKPKRGSFKRVIVTDLHGCKADAKARDAFLGDCEKLGDEVREVVILGDMVDCDGFLTQHEPQYQPRSHYSYVQDLAEANNFLDKLQDIFRKATYYYLEGNHEWRVERWIMKAAQKNGNPEDWQLLYESLSPEFKLGLKKRGIPYFRQGDQHMGLKVRGTIKLGPCYFMHGTTTNSKTASYKNLMKYADCIVHGHNHQQQQASGHFMEGEAKSVWCPGCLAELNPIWNHSDPCSWTHGYGLQCVNPDLSFHHINVPLIGGKSLLAHL